jgi:hypothetical protein
MVIVCARSGEYFVLTDANDVVEIDFDGLRVLSDTALAEWIDQDRDTGRQRRRPEPEV